MRYEVEETVWIWVVLLSWMGWLVSWISVVSSWLFTIPVLRSWPLIALISLLTSWLLSFMSLTLNVHSMGLSFSFKSGILSNVLSPSWLYFLPLSFFLRKLSSDKRMAFHCSVTFLRVFWLLPFHSYRFFYTTINGSWSRLFLLFFHRDSLIDFDLFSMRSSVVNIRFLELFNPERFLSKNCIFFLQFIEDRFPSNRLLPQSNVIPDHLTIFKNSSLRSIFLFLQRMVDFFMFFFEFRRRKSFLQDRFFWFLM